MKNILPFLIVVSFLFIATKPLHAQWIQTNSPYGQSINCFAISSTNLFAGTGSGVFLSTNNGTSWVNVGLTYVYALAVSGTNLFAGTQTGGVFLSTNNGTSWTAVNTGLTGAKVNALAVSDTNLFAGTNDGVFLSTDNGTNWTAVSTGLTNTDVLSLAVSGTNLFAGTDGGVFLSTNNGTSWTAVNTGLTNTAVWSLAISGTNLFAGTNGSGVFLSTNNGTSWTAVNTGLTNTQVSAFAISGTNLFAGTLDGIFLSTNNGTSWTAVNNGLTATYVTALAISGTNLFAGTLGGVFLSTNNGTSWTKVNNGLTSGVGVLAVSGTNLFVGTGDGVSLSTNNGTSWTEVNTGLTKAVVLTLAVSGANLLAGTWYSGVFLSTNNGTSWTAINNGLTNHSIWSLGVSGTNLFAGTGGSGVFLSTNNGASWTAVSTGLPVNYVIALAFSGTNLFAGTQGDGVFRSTDNGISWTAVDSGLTGAYVRAFAVSGPNLFAAAGQSISLSTNNGTSWTEVGSRVGGAQVNAFAVSGTNLFAGTMGYGSGNYGGVFLSTNNGTSWVNTDLMNQDVNVLAVSGTNLFAGTSSGLWRRPLTEMITPQLSLSRSIIDQGNVRLGLPKRDTLTVRNIGTDTLKISTITTTSPVWSVSQTILTIPPNQSFIDTAIFIPNSIGVISGKLIITSNSPTSPDTIKVSGFGFGTPAMQFNTKAISFGNIKVGTFKDTTVTITNTGNDTLKISNMTSSRSTFTTRPTVNNIPPGQSLADTLRFAPTVVGADSALFVIQSNSGSSPDTIKVSGFGFGIPATQFNTKAISFGNIKVGTFKDTTVTITNTGNDTLKISNMTSSRSTFTTRPTVNNIPPGQSLADTLRFAPTVVGADSALFVIQSNSGSSPDTIKVAGVAIPTTSVENIGGIPTEYALSQNYPNPFNPSTTLNYALPERSIVRLVIYNILGQMVKELINTEQQAGYQSVVWNANVSSGMYFYRIEATSVEDPIKRFVETKKMLLLR